MAMASIISFNSFAFSNLALRKTLTARAKIVGLAGIKTIRNIRELCIKTIVFRVKEPLGRGTRPTCMAMIMMRDMTVEGMRNRRIVVMRRSERFVAADLRDLAKGVAIVG